MKPSAEKSLTVRIPTDLVEELEKFALSSGLNKSAVTVAALRAYMETEAGQVQNIEQGIAEADRGEFATAGEVKAFFAKYGD